MRGGRYVSAIGWRVAAFLALSIGFPFIVYAIASLTRCGNVGGACGAVALMASLILRPLIVAAFVASLIGPSWKRARRLGWAGLTGLLAPLLLVADWMFLMLWGAHWSAGFVLGAFGLSLPVFALLALLWMALLATTAERIESGTFRERWGWIGTVILATIVAAIGLKIAGMGFSGLWLRAMDPNMFRWARLLSWIAQLLAALAIPGVLWLIISDLWSGPRRNAPPSLLLSAPLVR